MTTPAAEPRALYVHVPCCRTRCGYCDFYSEILAPDAAGPLVTALCSELRLLTTGRDTAFTTVFVGGGTPTCLPAEQLRRLLRACASAAGPGLEEFTVEANPATVTPEIAAALAEAGVTRISLGAQSFEPAELRVLERTHTPEQVRATVATCRAHGFDDLNLDLIFGIPGQTLTSWRASLAAALALEPTHLACYGLTYEPGTRLHAQREAGRVRPVDPDLEADMYEAALDTLQAAGFVHYEISNFARPGRECRHNLTYWRNEPYFGVGPSAAGFVDGIRYKNVADTARYAATLRAGRLPEREEERLNAAARARETAMLALRLAAGIDRRRFARRFGADPAELFAEAVKRHTGDGLLEVTPTAVRLTRRGMLLADCVLRDFV